MDKQRFRIDKNEKLIAVIEKRKATVINNYYDSDDNLLEQDPQTIMGKPVVPDTAPRNGQTLVYNAENKQWEAGVVDNMRGVAVFVSATEPIDKEINDLWIQI